MEKKSTSPGITPIQRENAKNYVPEMTADGWPEFDGFVPDESQIVQSNEKNKAMRAEIEEAISASVPEELDDAADSNYDADYLKEADAIQRYVGSTDPDEITIMPGMKLDRYAWKGKGGKVHYQDGSDDAGSFFGTPETSFEERSLPSPRNEYDYYEYEILKPFNVRAGVAAKSYDQPGGGDQYMTLDEQKVNWLIENGYIRVTRFNGKEVGKDTPVSKPEENEEQSAQEETPVEKGDRRFSILTLVLTIAFGAVSIYTFTSFKDGGFFTHLLTGITTFAAICAELFLLKKYKILKNTRVWASIFMALFAFNLLILPILVNKVFSFVIWMILTVIALVLSFFLMFLPMMASSDEGYKITTTTIDESGRSSVETQTYKSKADMDAAARDLKSRGYTEE